MKNNQTIIMPINSTVYDAIEAPKQYNPLVWGGGNAFSDTGDY